MRKVGRKKQSPHSFRFILMHNHHWLWLLAGIGLVVNTALVHAQLDSSATDRSRSSHSPLPAIGAGTDDPETILNLHLKRAREMSLLEQMSQNDLQKLAKILEGNANGQPSPDMDNVKKSLAKLAQTMQLTDQEKRQLAELAEKLIDANKVRRENGTPAPTPAQLREQIEQARRFLKQDQTESTLRARDLSGHLPNTPGDQRDPSHPAAEPVSPQADQQLQEHRDQVLQQLRPMEQQLGRHPALQQVVRGLARDFATWDGKPQYDKQSSVRLHSYLPRLTDYVKRDSLSLDVGGNWRSWRPPSLPEWSRSALDKRTAGFTHRVYPLCSNLAQEWTNSGPGQSAWRPRSLSVWACGSCGRDAGAT